MNIAGIKKDLARAAAVMYFEQDMSQNEIASALSISRSYVSQLLAYARAPERMLPRPEAISRQLALGKAAAQKGAGRAPDT